MLYVSSQICHGRLIIFQPGADTDVWHDVFLYLFGPVDGWFLTGPNSKLERVSASWQQITFGTECWIFFVARGWERVQSFDWAMHFCLVRLTAGPYR